MSDQRTQNKELPQPFPMGNNMGQEGNGELPWKPKQESKDSPQKKKIKKSEFNELKSEQDK